MKKIFVAIAIVILMMAGAASGRIIPLDPTPRPETPVENVAGETQTFSVRMLGDGEVVSEVVWYLDTVQVEVDGGDYGEYTATAIAGTHVLKAASIDTLGEEVAVEWTWVVSPIPIPEFPSIALPIVAILGLVFILRRRR